jgi:putative PIN family toxin of toxin-antitoxin system
MCTSQPLLVELAEVLNRAKFRSVLERRHTSVDELITAIVSTAEISTPVLVNMPEGSRDEDDIIVFEGAKASKADYIVSGDDDLLHLGSFEGIPIVSPSDFLDIIQ